MTSARKLYANRWIRYLLTGMLLVLVALKIRPERVSAALASARPGYLALALVLTIPFLYLKILRWYLMLRAADVRASFPEAALSLVGGMGLALLTPARLGELVRVAYLRDPQKWKIGGLVMIDKAFDVLVLAGLSVAGAWRLLGPTIGVAFTLVTLLGLLLIYRSDSSSRMLLALSARLPLGKKIADILAGLQSLSARSTTVFLTLTLASFVVVLLQFAIILLSWKGWSMDIVFLTFPLVILTNILPITIGGLGVREGAAALLLAHYGVSAGDAALAAFLMFAINTALPGIIGALFLPPASRRVTTRPAPSLDGS